MTRLALAGKNPRLPDDALPVHLVRQDTNYSCGAAALLAVLRYWGVDDVEEEDELHDELDTTPRNGTEMDEMRRGAAARGLEADCATGMTVDDLRMWLALGEPVIVDLQAWSDDSVEDYDGRTDSGHYVVVIGADDENLYFMDPSVDGTYAYLPEAEFVERWHDVEVDGEFAHHAVLWIAGDAPRETNPETREVVRMG